MIDLLCLRMSHKVWNIFMTLFFPIDMIIESLTIFSLSLSDIESPVGDTLFLLEKYQNEMNTVKEYLYDGKGMVPYMNKRYWYNFEKGNFMIGTHYYDPDNVEYISYLWSDIEGVKMNKNIAVGSTEKELLLAYTNDLYYIDKEEAISGGDSLSVISIK